jgi:hypothetical protein
LGKQFIIVVPFKFFLKYVCVFFLERLLIFKNEVFPIRISRYDFLKTKKEDLISKVSIREETQLFRGVK